MVASSVSMNRLPPELCVPNDGLRQITVGPRARLAALFVGSTSSTSANVPSAIGQAVPDAGSSWAGLVRTGLQERASERWTKQPDRSCLVSVRFPARSNAVI